MRAIFLILATTTAPLFSEAQQELLDTTYGANGQSIVDFLDRDETRSTTIDSSDRLLIAGTNITTFNSDLYVCRLNLDGTIDDTFAPNGETPGFFQYMPESSNGRWFAPLIKALNSGKIIVGMAFVIPVPGTKNVQLVPHILQLNSDGSLDTTFGINGVQVLDGSAGVFDIYEGENGELYIANLLYVGDALKTKLVRISSNGQSVDESFASEALQQVSSPYFDFYPIKILQAGGNLIFLNHASLPHPIFPETSWPNEDYLVVWQISLNDFQLNTSYGDNGSFTYKITDNSIPTKYYSVYDGVVNYEGNLLVTLMYYGDDSPGLLLKISGDGHLRTDFFENGVMEFSYSASSCNKFTEFAKHPSNGYYILGYNGGILDACANSTIRICQVNDDGIPLSIDGGTDGSIEIIQGFTVHRPSVQIQSDGNLLVTSFYFPYQENNDTDIKTVRILADMVSSVEEPDETIVSEPEMKLFPNPASTTLTVQLNFPEHTAPGNGIELVMHDLHGRIVYRQNHPELGNGEARIEVGHLPAGLYTLHCTVDGVWVDATKIVVE
jgi:hypothetical protein